MEAGTHGAFNVAELLTVADISDRHTTALQFFGQTIVRAGADSEYHRVGSDFLGAPFGVAVAYDLAGDGFDTYLVDQLDAVVNEILQHVPATYDCQFLSEVWAFFEDDDLSPTVNQEFS